MAACTQPGCAGAIEDGYCNACGMAPAGAPAAVAATGTKISAAPVGPSAAGSARTGSGRTPSTRSSRSTRSTRSTRTGSTRMTTRAMGGIPQARPPLPPQDPIAALVPGEVPERKRFCGNCDAKLSREGGFCPKCGQEYSFKPTLAPGDVVAGKYEIKGTMAFGGLGWIYLALDTVLNRWTVLKGLLNARDPRMLEVAVREREFLAAVKHPNIVGIYDFVTQGNEGFIVMEYVNGKTLMTLRKEHGGPLPVTEAIAYILEVLPAFDYLDQNGLVYCDFKPENVMVEETTVKLVDLGAVRQVDDTSGDIYGSKGYSAPEATSNPTPVSDLYSVGRALAVLVASFDFQGAYESSLPPAADVEVFAQHEALYRFLVKATRKEANARFQTASEMAAQLLGVLREVAGGTLDLSHIQSALFDADSDKLDTEGSGRVRTDDLPRLRVNNDDKAASVIIAAGAVADPARRKVMFERALASHPDSLELELRLVDELITLGDYAGAEKGMARVQAKSPDDWRIAWYRGRWLLGQGKVRETQAAFQAIMDDLPGELAPKQALGRACELSGDVDRAIRYYDAVSRADPLFASAAFGLARCLSQKGDVVGAVAAYRRVQASSTRHAQAQAAVARLLASGRATPAPLGDSGTGYLPDAAALGQASDAAEVVGTLSDGLDVHRLRAEVFTAAARAVEAPSFKDGSVTILGVPLESQALRLAAETELRTCARMVETLDTKIRFVDEANRVRPVTLV